MRKLLASAALSWVGWLICAAAQAQQVTAPIGPSGIAGAYNTTPPAISSGFSGWLQIDSTGNLRTTSSSQSYIPLSPGQHNLAIASSTALTVPTGATYATVCASSQAVNYTTDGTTTPTAALGQPLASGQCVSLYGSTVIANFRAIQKIASATLDVEYFR